MAKEMTREREELARERRALAEERVELVRREKELDEGLKTFSWSLSQLGAVKTD